MFLAVLLHSQVTHSEVLVIHVPHFFSVGSSQEARAQVIWAGLQDPTPDIGKAIAEAEAASKGKYP